MLTNSISKLWVDYHPYEAGVKDKLNYKTYLEWDGIQGTWPENVTYVFNLNATHPSGSRMSSLVLIGIISLFLIRGWLYVRYKHFSGRTDI